MLPAERADRTPPPQKRCTSPFGSGTRAPLSRPVAPVPPVLLLGPPTAGLGQGAGKAFGEVVARVAGRRSRATLILSEDEAFSTAAATRRLALQAATGDLKPQRKRLFGF